MLNSLGALSLASGKPAEAGIRYQQALALATRIGSPYDEARALEGIGLGRQRESQPEQAAALLRQVLELYRQIGSPHAERLQDHRGAGSVVPVADTPALNVPDIPGVSGSPGFSGEPPPGDVGGDLSSRHPSQRYLRGRCPDSVAPGEVFGLLVSVVTDSDGALLKSFGVPLGGLPLLLVAHAPGFRVLSTRRQEVNVPVAGDSEPVMFELMADDPGHRRISVTAWLANVPVREQAVRVPELPAAAAGPLVGPLTGPAA